MPNYCTYDMKIKGEKNAVKELHQILQYKHPTLQMYRIFDAYMCNEEITDDGQYIMYITGDVAWSIISTMLVNVPELYENNDEKLSDYQKNIIDINTPKDKTTTDLVAETKRLDLETEVFSSEPGIGFQEHFVIKNGKILVNECENYEEFEYDSNDYEGETEDEKFKNFIKENDLPKDVRCRDTIYFYGGIKDYGKWTI